MQHATPALKSAALPAERLAGGTVSAENARGAQWHAGGRGKGGGGGLLATMRPPPGHLGEEGEAPLGAVVLARPMVHQAARRAVRDRGRETMEGLVGDDTAQPITDKLSIDKLSMFSQAIHDGKIIHNDVRRLVTA